jgi:hypothetical protein
MFDAWSQNDSELGLAFQAFELGIQIKERIIHAFKRNLKCEELKKKKAASVLPSYIYLVSLGCVHFDSWNFVIYPLRKVVCKFCLSCWDLSNPGAPCCVLGTIRKPLMSKGVMGVFLDLWRKSYYILNNFFIESSVKSKK